MDDWGPLGFVIRVFWVTFSPSAFSTFRLSSNRRCGRTHVEIGRERPGPESQEEPAQPEAEAAGTRERAA